MNARESLVGRAAELTRIEERLAAAPRAVIVVTGAFGVGKTTLVRAVRESAAEAGWVLVPHDRDAVVIAPDSTVLSAVAAISDDFETSVQRRSGGQSFAKPANGEYPVDDRHDAAVGSLLTGARLASQGSAAGDEVTRPGTSRPVRILITVDVQAPAPEVRDWLAGGGPSRSLGGQVAPAVILTSDRPEDQASLAAAADLVIALGPLDRSAVLDRLERMHPGLPAPELAAYADAISRDPTLLDSFLRLLPLIPADRQRSDAALKGP